MFYTENFLINLLSELDEDTNSTKIELEDILNYCNIFIIPCSKSLKKAKIIKCLNSFCIIIDTDCPIFQYRESLAHEISHVLLNHFSSKKPYDMKEDEANHLSLFLLMPTKKLEQELNQAIYYENIVVHLSSMFQVSHEFVIRRLDLYKKNKSNNDLFLSN